MSFLRQLIFGGIGSRPTSSVHSQTQGISKSDLTLEKIQIANTLHVLDLLDNETITALVMDIVNLTNQRAKYELQPCDKYLYLIQQGSVQNETASKPDEFFDMRVGLKVLQIETLEAAFRLVKNVLTKEKIKAKELEDDPVLIAKAEEIAAKAQEYGELLEQNHTLKSKNLQLQDEIEKADKKAKEAEANFIKDMHDVVDAEVSRIQKEVTSLKDKTQSISEDNEKLKARIRDQENVLNYTTKEIDEKERGVRTGIQELDTERIDLESSLQSAESDNQQLSKKLQGLKDNLEEQETVGEMNGKDYDEKMRAFLKNMEEFKQGIEQRNESRCHRLEEENEKLRQENHEFRYKLLDMGIREIFREKPAPGDKRRS